jgi:hypothetical protein
VSKGVIQANEDFGKASRHCKATQQVLRCIFKSGIFFLISQFISKSANLKGAPPNYTKSITKSA